ncbi:hypothetical protein LBMAG53_35220 [Planctomycetota bacterium]|nr:hypothetical protein LBMAG53_35220 [Planctomycetota bacterium]
MAKSEEPRPEIRPGFQKRRQRELNDYIAGEPGVGRLVARRDAPRNPCAHDMDHERRLPKTGLVVEMITVAAWLAVWWITEGRLGGRVGRAGCCAGTVYMVVE